MLPRSLLAAALLCLSGVAFAADDDLPPGGTVRDMDLSRPFGLPPGWHMVVTQAPPIDDHGEKDAGRLTLCIRQNAGPCVSALETAPKPDPEPQLHGFHVLDDARLVYPRAAHGRPLLLVQASSLSGFNGDHDTITQMISYDPGLHGFRRVYRYATGHNNNQEVRYFGSGPLKGDIVSAEPQRGVPYGYWITVNALTPAYTYRQVLRYRSATIYNDGNPLAAIDSEMPTIQRRLGLWRAGMPLPVPPHCHNPHLIRAELWCN
jgi:hypothetical protein